MSSCRRNAQVVPAAQAGQVDRSGASNDAALVSLWLDGRPPSTTDTYRRTTASFLAAVPPLRTCTVTHLRDWFATFGEGKMAKPQGGFWLGGYEKLFDTPTGTLTSAVFQVTHPFAAFRIGGGSHKETRVELIRADSGQVFFKMSGRNSETMRPVVMDLRAHVGKSIFIRVVDEHTGGYGHVNFDDFRFYAKRPRFANAVLPPKPLVLPWFRLIKR